MVLTVRKALHPLNRDFWVPGRSGQDLMDVDGVCAFQLHFSSGFLSALAMQPQRLRLAVAANKPSHDSVLHQSHLPTFQHIGGAVGDHQRVGRHAAVQRDIGAVDEGHFHGAA